MALCVYLVIANYLRVQDMFAHLRMMGMLNVSIVCDRQSPPSRVGYCPIIIAQNFTVQLSSLVFLKLTFQASKL
jgi:hypothetical protein